MTLNVTIRTDVSRATEGFKRAPSVMIQHIERQQSRGALELSREMRRQAPKAFSHLVNSINVKQEGVMHFSVGPGVKHGSFVEGGTGPGGAPSVGTMLHWIRVKGISSERYPDEYDLARAIVHKIRARGTPAQPFAAPAAAKMESRLIELMDQGIDNGLREALA